MSKDNNSIFDSDSDDSPRTPLSTTFTGEDSSDRTSTTLSETSRSDADSRLSKSPSLEQINPDSVATQKELFDELHSILERFPSERRASSEDTASDYSNRRSTSASTSSVYLNRYSNEINADDYLDEIRDYQLARFSTPPSEDFSRLEAAALEDLKWRLTAFEEEQAKENTVSALLQTRGRKAYRESQQIPEDSESIVTNTKPTLGRLRRTLNLPLSSDEGITRHVSFSVPQFDVDNLSEHFQKASSLVRQSAASYVEDEKQRDNSIEKESPISVRNNLVSLAQVIPALQVLLQSENQQLKEEYIPNALHNFMVVAGDKFPLAMPIQSFQTLQSGYYRPPVSMLYKQVLVALVDEQRDLDNQLEFLDTCKQEITSNKYSNLEEVAGLNNLIETTIKNTQAIVNLSAEHNPLLSQTMKKYLEYSDDIGDLSRYKFALLSYQREIDSARSDAQALLDLVKIGKEQNTASPIFYEKLESQLSSSMMKLDSKSRQSEGFRKWVETKADILARNETQLEDEHQPKNKSSSSLVKKLIGVRIDRKGFYRKDKRKIKIEAEKKQEFEKEILQAGKKILDEDKYFAQVSKEGNSELHRSPTMESISSVYSTDTDIRKDREEIESIKAAIQLADSQIKQQKELFAIAKKQLDESQRLRQRNRLPDALSKYGQQYRILEDKLSQDVAEQKSKLQALEEYRETLISRDKELQTPTDKLARRKAVLKKRLNDNYSTEEKTSNVVALEGESANTVPVHLCLPISLKSLIADDMQQYPDLIESKEERQRYLQVLKKIEVDLSTSARWAQEKYVQARKYAAEHYETVFPDTGNIKTISLVQARFERQLLVHMEDLYSDSTRVANLINKVTQLELAASRPSLQGSYEIKSEVKENGTAIGNDRKHRMRDVFNDNMEISRNKRAIVKKGKSLVEEALRSPVTEQISQPLKRYQAEIPDSDNYHIEKEIYKLFGHKKYYQELIKSNPPNPRPPFYQLVNAGKDRQSFSGPCLHVKKGQDGKPVEGFILVEGGRKQLPIVARLNKEQLMEMDKLEVGQRYSVKASSDGKGAKITTKSTLRSIISSMRR